MALGAISSVAVAARAAIDASSWRPGGRYAAPFSLDVPAMPTRFPGNLFETDVRVAVVVDALESLHASTAAARAFPLAATSVVVAATAPLHVAIRAPTGRSIRVGPGVGLAIGAAILVSGLLLALVGYALLATKASVGWAFVLISASVPCLLLGGVLLFLLLRRSRSRRKLGSPSWDVGPGVGGTRVTLRLLETARVANVWLGLKIHQSVQMPGRNEDGVGMGRDADVARLRFDLVPVGPGSWCADIPAAALASLPESFDLPGNRVYWFAEINVECEDGDVWSEGAQLTASRGARWQPLTAFWYE